MSECIEYLKMFVETAEKSGQELEFSKACHNLGNIYNSLVSNWMDGTDGWMEWMDGWIGGWMDGWMDGWMQRNGWMDGWNTTDGWMDGTQRMDGWMGGWVDGWKDGWMCLGGMDGNWMMDGNSNRWMGGG